MIIIELHNHSEVVYNIGLLLDHLSIDYSIVGNERVLQDCSVLSADKILLKDFNLNQYHSEFILFTTILANDQSTLKDFKAQGSIGVIHNIHSFFYRKENKISPLSLNSIKHLLRGKSSNTESVLESVDHITSPRQWMIDLGKKRYTNKWLSLIPFSFVNEIPENNNQRIKVGIPGAVAPQSRDYDLVLQALKKCKLKKEVELHFSGSLERRKSNSIVQKFVKELSKLIKIVTHGDYLPLEEYEGVLKTMDFLIVPCNRDYILGNVKEVYGASNITGAESDMLKYAIPSLWTAHYPLDEELEKITERFYDADTLADKLDTWINDEKFNTFNNQREMVYQTYKIDKQAQLLKNCLIGAGFKF